MTLAIMEEQVKLHALLTKVTWQEDEFPVIRVQFRNVTTSQHRRLVEMLYCRPGQWKRRASPGELTSLFLLLKTLFVPRILFDRRININPIPVTKG
jgi:cellulose synthase (UDP-forming)